jgi:hypothetical protein
MAIKKVNENKLSVLVDQNSLPLVCAVSPANILHDSQLYEPTPKHLRFSVFRIAL